MRFRVGKKTAHTAEPEKATPQALEENTTAEVQPSIQSGTEDDVIDYPTGLKLAAIMLASLSCVFLSALDENIIGTAIPKITDEFNSLKDIGWYGSAYFLTLSSFMMIYGRAYDLFTVKWVYLFAVLTFEIGSLICGLAPNSTVLIVGRAISGLGSAGINSGFMIIISLSLPLQRRPAFVSGYSAVYGVATVIAPPLGGAFTTKVSWRWCFFINLPFGVIAAAIMIFSFADLKSAEGLPGLSLREKIKRLDFTGTGLLLASTACLLLSLQWGGTKYDWSDGRVIGLLVTFFVLAVAFAILQSFKKELATVPPRIIRERSIAAAAFYLLTTGAAMNVFEYYACQRTLPIWFQAIQGVTALESGIRLLPTIVGFVLFSFVASYGVSKVGYYTPFMIAGSICMAIGSGLITTWRVDTKIGMWVGFQILNGAGSGLGMAQAHMAAQTVLKPADISSGAVVLLFSQMFGGAVFIGVSENIFSNRLVANLAFDLPDTDLGFIVDTGATNLWTRIGGHLLSKVLVSYNHALTQTFFVPTALSTLSFLGALATEWRSVSDPA